MCSLLHQHYTSPVCDHYLTELLLLLLPAVSLYIDFSMELQKYFTLYFNIFWVIFLPDEHSGQIQSTLQQQMWMGHRISSLMVYE